jgi:hypothetical protein
MLSKVEKSDIDVKVKEVIADIKRMHFLGSSNHKFDPTGGLSGYYRNVAFRVYSHYLDQNRIISPVFYPYLMMAMMRHTGAGNCGEMTGALYTALHLQELTAAQKKSIEFKHYQTGNEHQNNAYVLVGETVFDIWDSKTYKKSRIKAKTHVDEKYHQTFQPINPNLAMSQVKQLYESIYVKFSTSFDEELNKDRQKNHMYVTFDTTDSSNFALFASQAFPWLLTQFNATVTDAYFITHPELACDIRTKIINNFVYLIEELRKEIPASGVATHPKQRQYFDNEIEAELFGLLNNAYFIKWLIAMSYRNSQPQRCIELLEASLIELLAIDQNNTNNLVQLLIQLSKQTIKQLASLMAENGSTVDELSASQSDAAGVAAQEGTRLSEHVALSIFNTSSGSLSYTTLEGISAEAAQELTFDLPKQI